jgi:hypothetical protein
MCSACLRDRKKYWKKNRGRFVQRRKDEYEALNTERRMFRAARCRALRDGIPFTILPEDIVIPEFCPVLGLRLERAKGKATASSPSLDKIIPSLGYVRGNIWVISHRANTLKHDATLEELEKLVIALRNLQHGCNQ